MKHTISLLLLVLIAGAFSPAFSQGNNILKIVVNGPRLIDIGFNYNNNSTVGPVEAGDLQLQLSDNQNIVKRVVLVNKLGNRDSITLSRSDLGSPLDIINRKVNGQQLADNFEVEVCIAENKWKHIQVKLPQALTVSSNVSSNNGPKDTAPAGPGGKPAPQAAAEVNKVGAMINDAIKLSTLGTSREEALDILAFYAGVEQNWHAVDSAYKNNIHLQDLVDDKAGKKGAQANANPLTSFLQGVGGLDVTTLALGTTDFIIKRAKEELNVAFFKRFQEFISKPEYEDIRTLFPGTWQTLTFVGTDIYNYNRYLQTLQNAFKSDIAQLTDNLPGIIDNHPVFFEIHPELNASLRSGVYIAQSLRYGVHPAEIVDRYDASLLEHFGRNIPGVGNDNPDFKTSVQIIQLLSFALRNNTDDNTAYWVNPEMVRRVFGNEKVTKYFLGLLYQYGKHRFKTLNFKTGGATTDVLATLNNASIFNNLQAWNSYLSALAVKAQSLNNLVKTYDSKGGDSLKIEQLYTYFQAAVGLLEQATYVTQLPGLTQPGFKRDFSVYFETARASATLIVNANRGQYTAAITDAARIYALVRNKDLAATIAELNTRLAAATTAVDSAALQRQLHRARATDSLTKGLFRYGTFMATVADAKTPGEVSDAIEAFALPAGSARIKRESAFNVSLNAYAGLFAGYERILGLEGDKKFKLNAYGLTVPIGVAVSTGKNHWSYSAFLSFVDLGAVAAFRTQNDSVNEVPSIQLKDIFSPGLFFSLGIPKSPVSVNLGAQVGPNLRKVAVEGNDYSGNTYLRFSLSVLVDIPVLNFYTKTKDE
jgi:hypothetical protein